MISFFKRIVWFALCHSVGKAYDFKLYLIYLKYRLLQRIRGPRIERIPADGQLTSSVCVFSLYQPQGVSETTYYLLSAIAEAGFGLYVISNVPILADDRRRLSKMAWRIEERENFGRDFGGYKRGIDVLASEGLLESIDRLMLANDTILGPVHSLKDVIDSMDAKDCDYWGLTENQKDGNHVSSFFLVFKKSAFTHWAFTDFWRRYKTKSSRRHAIRRGEAALSLELRKGGLSPDVYCSGQRLVSRFIEEDDLAKLFLWLSETPFASNLLPSLGLDMKTLRRYLASEQHRDLLRHQIARYAVHHFERSSTPQTFAIFLNRELGMPVIKKDTVKRGVQDLGYLLARLEISTDLDLQSIANELRIRGVATDHDFIARLLWEAGYT